MNDLSEWQQSVLQAHLERYEPHNVFNADESGLFFKAFPNKTLEFKGKKFLYFSLKLIALRK